MISKVFCRQFRYALLNKDEKLIAELEKNVLCDGATASEIENEKLWAETAFPLVEEAISLREQGCSIRSSKFDSLEERANQVGYPLPAYLRGIVHSSDAIEYHATGAISIPAICNKSASKIKKTTKKKALKTKGIVCESVPKQKPASKSGLMHCLENFKKTILDKNNDETQVKLLRDEIINLYPDSVKKVNRIVEIGKAAVKAFEAGQMGISDEDFEICYKKLIEPIAPEDKNVQAHIRSLFFRGKTIREWESYRTNEFSDDHPNFLSNLTPSKKWTVLIDEAGDTFFNDAKDGVLHSRGRLAAIIVPDYCNLPNLSANFHSRDLPNEAVKQIVDTIIQSPCGVLGIPVDALRKNDSELWYKGIETLIDLIVHILPIDGKTSLDIMVEQRTEYTPEKSSQLFEECSNCLQRLAQSNPYRAKMIDISAARFINKSDHPWNGYADTIAHCWGGFSVSEALNDSEWINSCLLDFKPDVLRHIVNVILRKKPLSEVEWSEYLAHPAKGGQKMLACLLLKIQGEEARHDVKRWKKYFDYVQRELNSRLVDYCALEKKCSWLKLYAPDEMLFSPRRQLIWLTTQLTKINNLGKIDFVVQHQKELEELCGIVFPEDAPLTCQTSLQVASAYMNDFNFRTAYNVIKGWLGVDGSVPGIQRYGQVLSTIGQLNAFIGQQNAAIEACNLAIDQFENLADKDKRENNINQTLSYKVIAMMDCETIPENMTQEMERYLGRTLMEAAEHFAVTSNNDEKYMHHVFLRYLVHVNSPELKPIIDRYLSLASEWKTGNGHPWELILFYRALLRTELSNKKINLEQAYYNVFRSNNETLDVTACVILGGLYYYNSKCKTELTELTQRVIQTKPYLGKKRIEALKNQLETPQEPLALAKAVLPFNYR